MTQPPETAGAPPGALALPPARDTGVLLFALFAVSTSGPLIAATAAPALAVAFWRNAIASGVLLPWAWWGRRTELRALGARERRLAVLAGLLLAAHFSTWIPSVRMTTVSSATALVATQPVWAALLHRARGGRLPRAAWVGVWIAVVGAGVLSGADLSLSSRALAGDLLAVVGAVFAAAYVTAGGEVRRQVSTVTYTAVCYTVTATTLAVVCLVGRQSFSGYSGADWLRILALTGGAQLLGHSLFNVVLRTTSPLLVSLAILLEVPGAATLAAIFLHQGIRLDQLPGAALLAVGIVTVVRAGVRAIPTE